MDQDEPKIEVNPQEPAQADPKQTLSPANVGVILALLAVGIGLYNTHLIMNGTVGGSSTIGGLAAAAPEKILKELPSEAQVLGNPNAKLTLIEFGDFQCPYCGQWQRDIFPQIKKDYIDTGKVKFIYLDYAFLGQESKDAAEAAQCAREQGKFWEYHDQLFANQQGENQGNFNVTNLKIFAANINLNPQAFESCISDTKYDQLIAQEQSLAGKYGASATPSFLIGKNSIRGVSNINNFKQIIDQQL